MIEKINAVLLGMLLGLLVTLATSVIANEAAMVEGDIDRIAYRIMSCGTTELLIVPMYDEDRVYFFTNKTDPVAIDEITEGWEELGGNWVNLHMEVIRGNSCV